MVKKYSFPILDPKKLFSINSKKGILFWSKKDFADKKESIVASAGVFWIIL